MVICFDFLFMKIRSSDIKLLTGNLGKYFLKCCSLALYSTLNLFCKINIAMSLSDSEFILLYIKCDVVRKKMTLRHKVNFAATKY